MFMHLIYASPLQIKFLRGEIWNPTNWFNLPLYSAIMMHSFNHLFEQEEFEDTKWEIRNRISKTNRQHNGQKKKYKRTNNDRRSIHIKLKIEKPAPH